MRKWLAFAMAGLSVAATGCAMTAQHPRLTVSQPAGPRAAATAASAAQDALLARNPLLALGQAETAVGLAPQDANYRALLGRAYLANGRFGSAETAFGDAQALDATMGRIAVIKALAELAQGKADAALATLDGLKADQADAEAGLALMLAGRREAGLDMIEAAARAPGADARARQNLALGYALLGRWDAASATAARDVPADQIPDRLRRWSQIAAAQDPAQQVAALLGVAPVQDPGMPTALALVTPTVTPAEPAPVLAEAAPQPEAIVEPAAPVAIAEQAPVAQPVVAPAPIMAVATIEKARTAAPARLAAPKARPVFAMVSKPKSRTATVSRGGDFTVQLGAFSSAHRTEAAWGRIAGKAGYLAAYTPSGSDYRVGKATLYRLSVGGIATRAEAAKLCTRIKAAGGSCFVRATANDRPLEWAQRREDARRA
ncbi:SPOR domain-containing protein [Sphingomonas crocodyli]|uniref:Sporulation protein n=1 Tax=Sphingomonas crocodyli TaxID=1979270 RepID=A0A437M9E2_9SPHN|nr:SPOR domain-containing protein [Sphingomonas crocodyli]RVT94253.1 sporulation protein [Sphingomonas crocodyli]